MTRLPMAALLAVSTLGLAGAAMADDSLPLNIDQRGAATTHWISVPPAGAATAGDNGSLPLNIDQRAATSTYWGGSSSASPINRQNQQYNQGNGQ